MEVMESRMNTQTGMFIKEITLLSGLCVMSVEDIRRKEIRRIWLILLGAAGVLWMIVGGEIPELDDLARFIPGILCLLVAGVTREQLGRGDAVLILIMGCYLSAGALMSVCMIAFAIAGTTALVLLVVAKKSKKYTLPMIPFLLAGYVMLCFF